jgi:hypothetical protein
VALARSAAPPEVSDDATVLALERGVGFVVAERGTNGVTCLVDRSWPQAIEPHCYDPEGARTILPIRLREMELREGGKSKSAIQADIAEGLRTGRFVVPTRPAVTWMMSAGQVLYNDEGVRVGAWKPHLMIYYPFLRSEDLGFGQAPPADGPMLSDPGRPTANLVIVMPSFVPVRGADETSGEAAHAPSARRSALRARDNWLFDVPGEMSSIPAISSWENPYTPKRTRTVR